MAIGIETNDTVMIGDVPDVNEDDVDVYSAIVKPVNVSGADVGCADVEIGNAKA